MYSQSLTEAVHAASTALEQNPTGELPLAVRRRIEALFGPSLGNGGEHPAGPGHRRRARLAILCVQQVLPLWRQAYPEDNRPQQMLDLAEPLLDGRANPEQALGEQHSFWAELGDIANEEVAAACVGYASVQAVSAAAADTAPGDYDPEQTDHDEDPDTWGADYFASMATAGGDPSVADSSVEHRRQFWRWYLAEAVPQAYNSVPS